jgi:hypothetical protein
MLSPDSEGTDEGGDIPDEIDKYSEASQLGVTPVVRKTT